MKDGERGDVGHGEEGGAGDGKEPPGLQHTIQASGFCPPRLGGLLSPHMLLLCWPIFGSSQPSLSAIVTTLLTAIMTPFHG